MGALSLLIKPASSSCNMKCKYCFYSDVANSREIANYGMMSKETIEIIIKKAFEYADTVINFGFQGGEPTLAGLDFFKEVVRLQKQYNVKRIKVHNAIQTNGLLINDEWAQFLHDNNFLVGVSLDGNQMIHDKYRLDSGMNGTFQRVLEATKILKKHRVEFNILSTVNKDVAKNIDKIYYFFKKQGFNYLQFIPCLDGFNEEHGKTDFSLSPEDYGDFLIELFKLWYVDVNSKNPISIRFFDNLVLMMGGYPPESCGMAGVCSCYYMIEADGSVYPCDFYVTDEWRIGDIRTDSWDDMRKSETAKRFVSISRKANDDCLACEHFKICRGGCRRNREPISEDNPNKNFLCPSFKAFFDYAKDDIEGLAKRLLR